MNYASSPAAVAKASDIVSVHLALNAETKGMIDADFFEAMRPGAFFINTSRAEVVDPVALEWAIRDKKLRVGLDVFAKEPAGSAGEFADEIVKLNTVYGTHHIGASTDQAQEAIAAETVRIVRTFKETGKVPNVVNIAKATPATCALVVRHLDRPGVLAGVLDADQRRPDQRAGDGEHHLRRGAGGCGAHQPGSRTGSGTARAGEGVESECARSSASSG